MGKLRKGGGVLQTTIHGCRIHYQVRRKPDSASPPILLLHGWGCDSTIFSFIEEALAELATVITLDFPGHGQSDEPPQPWGVGEYANQVCELLAQLGETRVRVVAHSFGGRVAIKLATANPALVEKLVITGGAGIRKPATEQSKKRAARYKRYTAFLELARRLPLLHTFVDSLQVKLRKKYGSPDYVKLNENMRKTFVKVISEDLFPLLQAIHAPTLLIWGSADTETPLWMGQAMEKEIPDAGLVVFEGGTHFAFLEQWRRFVMIVKQFFMEEQA